LDEERKPDRSRGSFGGIRGIVGSEKGSSAQLKGVETTVVGIRGSEMGTGDDSEGVIVGSECSVCVDMVAEEDGGMIREFV
jgi:hypothetical protein